MLHFYLTVTSCSHNDERMVCQRVMGKDPVKFLNLKLVFGKYFCEFFIIVHAHFPIFCATIFFAFHAQTRFKQAAVV